MLLRSAIAVRAFQLNYFPKINLIQFLSLLLVAGKTLALQREPSLFPARRVLLLQIAHLVIALRGVGQGVEQGVGQGREEELLKHDLRCTEVATDQVISRVTVDDLIEGLYPIIHLLC